jgi:hypothetical protein
MHYSEYCLCVDDFQLQDGFAIGGHVADQGESVAGPGFPAAGREGVGHAPLAVVQVVVEVLVGAVTAIYHGGVPPVRLKTVVEWHLEHSTVSRLYYVVFLSIYMYHESYGQ